MESYVFGDNYYYESSDFSSEHYPLMISLQKPLERHVDSIIKSFTRRRLFRELLELYGRKLNLKGNILLCAHGAKEEQQWMFTDGGEKYIIQDWIDYMDGKATTIILWCCNPRNYEIHSEKSAVIHPRDNVDIFDIVRGGYMRIFIPNEGYLENSYYKMRRAISKLRH